jgi:hypothetical protein
MGGAAYSWAREGALYRHRSGAIVVPNRFSIFGVTEPQRRFPPPWHADPMPGGYVVLDANGQALAYLYSRDNDAEARQAKVLTKDEARRIWRRFRVIEGGRA